MTQVQDSYLIGRILIDEGLVTPEQLEVGLNEQKKNGDFIGDSLVKLGFTSEEKVLNALSRHLNIQYLKLKDIEIDPLVIEKVPAKFASHYKIIPVDFKDNTLIVAMADPSEVHTLDDIKLLLGFEVKGILTSEEEILEAIRKYYGVGAETLEKIIAQKSAQGEFNAHNEKNEDAEIMGEDASMVKFVNQILSEAVKDRATDIHIEPFEGELRIRFRVDGVLYDISIPEAIKYFHSQIISRIKIMAQLNISERRLPQDGRIKIKVNGNELDLRVSTLPTVFGEGLHIRILSRQFFLGFEKLGFSSTNLNLVEQVIEKPHGIVFVTGPTGSGKSTTLYAVLSRINSAEVKIITIEDPVEYRLRGVNQLQVVPKIGFTFSSALRHMLRHDPDVMMVGEVRDNETAEIAIRAALTGHLVFSTLHTNDAASSVTRLLDMGIEPFLVSSSLECLIAQRLVRLICPKCKTPIKEKLEIIETMLKDVKFDVSKTEIYEGKGCQECRFTGYHGRTAIYEVLTVTPLIRKLILSRASAQEIKQKAIFHGMRTLRQDGFEKVLQGLTTFAEVARVTPQEELNETI